MNSPEGYIKFNCCWEDKDLIVANQQLQQLNFWRNKLVALKLIGCYANGIGYGNLSIRIPNSGQFIISGSATGHIPELSVIHYALVTSYDLKNNSLTCTGRTRASSESLSHAALYECLPDVQAVVHIHHETTWKRLVHQMPTTGDMVEYGTPEMAFEIQQLVKDGKMSDQGNIIMGGHREGIIAFGKTMEIAAMRILGMVQS